MLHELKCWPEQFAQLQSGKKKHEVRKDDRGYAVGNVLYIREWDPTTKRYTGQSLTFEVTYISSSQDRFGLLPSDVCVMSVEPWTASQDYYVWYKRNEEMAGSLISRQDYQSWRERPEVAPHLVRIPVRR